MDDKQNGKQMFIPSGVTYPQPSSLSYANHHSSYKLLQDVATKVESECHKNLFILYSPPPPNCIRNAFGKNG